MLTNFCCTRRLHSCSTTLRPRFDSLERGRRWKVARVLLSLGGRVATPFNDVLAVNGFAMLLLLHGETVTIRPKVGGSYERTAIVDRNPPALFNQAGEVVATAAEVRLHADATLGVDHTVLNTGGDLIDIEVRYGAAQTTHAIFQIISTDGGVVKLAVR